MKQWYDTLQEREDRKYPESAGTKYIKDHKDPFQSLVRKPKIKVEKKPRARMETPIDRTMPADTSKFDKEWEEAKKFWDNLHNHDFSKGVYKG